MAASKPRAASSAMPLVSRSTPGATCKPSPTRLTHHGVKRSSSSDASTRLCDETITVPCCDSVCSTASAAEIFRGTNHLESISAAAAVLHTLSQQGTVMVSSHNLVLASLLEERLTPWCVSRVGDGLQVAPGVLRETNGIALLAARGFDAAISAKAKRVFDWLSDYMAHSADCEGVRNSL